MGLNKLIIVLIFTLVFSACEDSPQEVGVYVPPTGTNPGGGQQQKVDPVENSKLKISIFNLENLGNTDFETSDETDDRIEKIEDTLRDKILAENDFYIFLGIFNENKAISKFKKILQSDQVSCAQNISGSEENKNRYTVVCFKEEIKLKEVKRLVGFGQLSTEINEDVSTE